MLQDQHPQQKMTMAKVLALVLGLILFLFHKKNGFFKWKLLNYGGTFSLPLAFLFCFVFIIFSGENV